MIKNTSIVMGRHRYLVDIIPSCDAPNWMVEIRSRDGKIIGADYDIPTREKAMEYAQMFIRMYDY